MNDTFTEKFRNRNIKTALLKLENIQALEEILHQKMITSSKFKGKFKRGRIPKRKELCLLLKEIKPEVDRYLGVSGISTPPVNYSKVDYTKYYERLAKDTVLPMLSTPLFLTLDDISLYTRLIFGLPVLLISSLATTNIIKKIIEERRGASEYNFVDKSIKLERQPVYDLIPTLAHEYAHHIQKEKNIPKEKYFSFFNEGQARSVQRHVSVQEMIKNDDSRFMMRSLDFDISELRATHMWLTKYFRKNTNACQNCQPRVPTTGGRSRVLNTSGMLALLGALAFR